MNKLQTKQLKNNNYIVMTCLGFGARSASEPMFKIIFVLRLCARCANSGVSDCLKKQKSFPQAILIKKITKTCEISMHFNQADGHGPQEAHI